MTDGAKVAAVLTRLLDGLGDCAKRRSHGALMTLCEAMRLAPLPLKTHLAKRLLCLEVDDVVETPLQYRAEVADAVQGIPTVVDHLEKFKLFSVEGEGVTAEDDQPPPKLRLVKE